MATKKSSTSKTARVMNLLSKSREDGAPMDESAAPVSPVESTDAPQTPAETPAPVHTAPTPPIITAMQTDSAISNRVMSALETALDDELSAGKAESAEKAPDPDPVAEGPVPVVEEPVPAVEESAPAVEEPVQEAAPATPVAAPAEENPAADDEPAPPTQFKVDRHTTYVNVMETLVEEKAAKYIDLFGLCKCHRCVADVKAYALNHLAPKYVVMRTGEVIPRISVYDGQFSADVTAQILTACKIVMAHPRHDLN